MTVNQLFLHQRNHRKTAADGEGADLEKRPEKL